MNHTHDTPFEIRLGDSFNYAREINKPYGELDRILAWCKTELTKNSWRWQLVEASTDQRPGRYIFFFTEERDYFAFTLYWQ